TRDRSRPIWTTLGRGPVPSIRVPTGVGGRRPPGCAGAQQRAGLWEPRTLSVWAWPSRTCPVEHGLGQTIHCFGGLAALCTVGRQGSSSTGGLAHHLRARQFLGVDQLPVSGADLFRTKPRFLSQRFVHVD